MFIEDNAIIDFDCVDTAIQSEILKTFVGEGESIFFPYDARNFVSDPSGEWSQFVRQRTAYIGQNPVAIPWGKDTQTHWYEANTDHDLE